LEIIHWEYLFARFNEIISQLAFFENLIYFFYFGRTCLARILLL